MSRSRPKMNTRWGALAARAAVVAAASAVLPALAAPNYPVTPDQRATAHQVAQAGVPLAELAPDAPQTHTVRPGDTLWDISKLFLKSPWRWPELWGMNLEQIRNPHLIYPGQLLVLVKRDGRAMLQVGQSLTADPQTVRLSPRVRAELLENGAIASIPLHLIGPFLNEAVVFDSNELELAPRIVATQEGRVLLSRGETAYVLGDLGGAREFRLFREAQPLRDPETREILGYEARYVGTAEYVRPGEERFGADGKPVTVPATFVVSTIRLEVGVGDRLSPVPQRELTAYAPHAPAAPIDGRIVSLYGDALSAGQNQIVALNKGRRDGLERGHVLALWRAGRADFDTTSGKKKPIQLPDERHGLLFVFSAFERVSYALIINVKDPVHPGDRFTAP
ncbi:peptidoglycan-binding protein [Rubrivivax gelatinosus]|uniref:Peptidoglycan-binding protein n=1 Tax=Rubrivivax gelatinosus TaxID=28068 RepID=A0ABS1DV04_RUBGE|nr:LysM domain-containing protein [Rubrivivax gelatinosus]MBK1612921.1 peptidoglycan-binding protein [Rubrivivax gelatinosus]MBK1713578.1 peptidoglycan-binding protein [Rubrivivax gelatinosus]